MKSIKRGRAPSMMGGVMGIAVAIFGVIWTIMASSMGAPFFFPLFGIVFIGIAIGQAIYNFKNATGENRYSEYDIVDENEEIDPMNRRFGAPSGQYEEAESEQAGEIVFCPQCGTRTGAGDNFCRKCGRRLR